MSIQRDPDGRWLTATAGETQFVFDLSAGVPFAAHFGAPIDPAAVHQLAAVVARPRARATIDSLAPAALSPEHASGWPGRPGIRGHRPDGSAWAPRFELGQITTDESQATVIARDAVAQLSVAANIAIMPQSVRLRLALTNDGDTPYQLNELTMTVPVPQRANELLHLVGYWSHEFQMRREPFTMGAHSFDNRRGRTSPDRVPALWVGEQGFGENHGDVWAFTLGWSGNAICSADYLTDGRRVVQLGELLASGDVTLAPGETYSSPWLEAAASTRGLNGVSQAFHASIRSGPVHPAPDSPRPIILNTWEAVYFNHELDTLCSLADKCAEVGAERFVLDDGWFHGRRSDDAGLGDWWVDETVWPDGLGPLVDHVTGLGLEFGIWFEPEMVNPDSDLYRAHPEWALTDVGYEPIQGRQQLVLNLGLSAVRSYLFDKINAVLSDYNIGYVKWDMNRDLVQASDGTRPAMHAHMHGVYALFDQLRAAHPGVEFESCSSGGSRADFEILKRAERIWTSDSNDALERQKIQRGFSLLFPPEVMGAHIGPPTSHTSGRTHPLSFRAATAFMGHLGIEWNLLSTNDDEIAQLAAIVAAHKEHRNTLRTGTVWRLDVPDPTALAHMVVAPDQRHALLSFAQLDSPEGQASAAIKLFGLNHSLGYRIEVLSLPERPSCLAEQQVPWWESSVVASGQLLETVGLQMPLLNPERSVVLTLAAD